MSHIVFWGIVISLALFARRFPMFVLIIMAIGLGQMAGNPVGGLLVLFGILAVGTIVSLVIIVLLEVLGVGSTTNSEIVLWAVSFILVISTIVFLVF